MEIHIEKTGKPCKLCKREDGGLTIHYPHFLYKVGDFVAPDWSAHVKYYCPHCVFLWTDIFDALTLSEYGERYVEANFDRHRRPAEARMKAAPLLLKEVIKLSGGARFLDYGVGYNVPYIYELRGRGIDLWGCDISTKVPYSRFIRQLPTESLPEGTFDGLYSLDVAEHLADVVNDYLTMGRLLKAGGYILHSTYMLHKMWEPSKGLPDHPMLRNPWHISLCSEKAMHVIAEKAGLQFIKSLRVNTDTGFAYLLKKPGTKKISCSLVDRFKATKLISLLNAHLQYVESCYK